MNAPSATDVSSGGAACTPRGAGFWDALAMELGAAVPRTGAVRREEPLGSRTTFRIGGAARVLVEPASEAELATILDLSRRREVPVLLLGRGSNLLVPDEGVEAVVISLGHAVWQVFDVRGDGRIWVGAGLRLKALCGLAAKAGLQGFEFLEGIPGNVGGALRMNAGAMGGWMFDIVEELRLMTLDGAVRTLRRGEIAVGYRHCAALDEAIALGALLRSPAAEVAESEAIRRQIDVYRDKRHRSQPREPSAGCIFKNPVGDSAGRLIDAAGLKGLRVGDAEVSPTHANFIVNVGQATSADVIALIRRVRSRVAETSGVVLEPEVLLFGASWDDALGAGPGGEPPSP